ncbi:hypothetical protein OUY22_27495 [Nonomuraea sp. MCN248]|uniref:PE domain-containing protein n=1 Tax=Nonomuraea corallina TaxID=2989783 RepID=A0ABT4SIW3_9ACTN|nr:hypothetical protein [Nonomuraea corallina]MDA0637163.1 hypothetical protein [Nonomuraea corallina]
MAQNGNDGGGGTHLRPDPGLFDERYNSPAALRTIATELRTSLDAMLGKGGRPNGNIDQISTGNGLSVADIGQWDDARSLASTIGSSNAGAKFAEVYQKFIEAYESVVEAVETSADNHDRARRANEGGS